MKQLVLHTRMYDRKTCEYVQRFLAVELTDHEAELFEELKASIDERTRIFPFKQKGWCDDDEKGRLNTPLASNMRDGEGGLVHRFSFSQGLYLEDTENDNYGCGWSGM